MAGGLLALAHHHPAAAAALGARPPQGAPPPAPPPPLSIAVLVASEVPAGAGVSSSAALEVASMTALAAALHLEVPPRRIALLCQQVGARGRPLGCIPPCHQVSMGIRAAQQAGDHHVNNDEHQWLCIALTLFVRHVTVTTDTQHQSPEIRRIGALRSPARLLAHQLINRLPCRLGDFLCLPSSGSSPSVPEVMPM